MTWIPTFNEETPKDEVARQIDLAVDNVFPNLDQVLGPYGSEYFWFTEVSDVLFIESGVGIEEVGYLSYGYWYDTVMRVGRVRRRAYPKIDGERGPSLFGKGAEFNFVAKALGGNVNIIHEMVNRMSDEINPVNAYRFAFTIAATYLTAGRWEEFREVAINYELI